MKKKKKEKKLQATLFSSFPLRLIIKSIIFAPNWFRIVYLLFGLKGNRVQIPDSPAAVKPRDVPNISATAPRGGKASGQGSVRRPARSIRCRKVSRTGRLVSVVWCFGILCNRRFAGITVLFFDARFMRTAGRIRTYSRKPCGGNFENWQTGKAW